MSGAATTAVLLPVPEHGMWARWQRAFRRALPVALAYFLLVAITDAPILQPFISIGHLLMDAFAGELLLGVMLAAGVAVVEARERTTRARIVGYLVAAAVVNAVGLVVWEYVMSSLGYWAYKWPWWVRFWANWGGSMVESLFAIALYRMWRGARGRAAALRDMQRTRAELQRETAQADLLAMQARIDPSFLFATLQAIERAYEAKPEGGRAMTDALIEYLRAALPGLDSATSTLGKECDLARAYLDLARERHALDLRVDVAVADTSRSSPFPPMLVLPIVEDVVKSLRELERPGRLTLRAAAAEGSATLAVAVEPAYQPSADTLALVRGRLAGLSAGAVSVRDATVTLEIPHAQPPGADR